LNTARGRRAAILAGFFLLALVNCGGGGGGGNDSGGGPVVADFAASCPNSDSCASNAVTSQKGSAAGNVVEVQFWLNKLNTTIGEASLDVTFDPSVAEYQGPSGSYPGYAEGTALGGSSGGTVYQVSVVGPGEVLADIAPPKGGMSISSPAILITLTFKLLKTSAGSNLNFRNPDRLDGSALYSSNGVIIPLSSSKWFGGIFAGT